MRVFVPHPLAEDRRRSAVTLIRLLLSKREPEMLPEHLEELLSVLLWKITEADGKYKTRHQSHDALTDRSQLRHDHVFTRKEMIAALLRAKPEEIQEILKNAIGCTVTADEHRRLSQFDKECDGWERYRKAGVYVTDTGREQNTNCELRAMNF